MKSTGKYSSVKETLDQQLHQLKNTDFIPQDPISVPHTFSQKQDIEIVGLFAAVFAWGLRKTIINKSFQLANLMDNAPYDFILHHQEKDLSRFSTFVHRTFNSDDTLHFIRFLQFWYRQNESLETAFSQFITPQSPHIEAALCGFYDLFFSLPHLPRTRRHISTPAKKASCKRLCMYLRWMVRTDAEGIDFGLWKRISPAQLVCPLDVHVFRVAQDLQLLPLSARNNWEAALVLTEHLRTFAPADPVKYDLALFSLGVQRKKQPFVIP
ncbi:MAG: TIGR02757 family protein [Chitinophagales bacterium]|nr:TIGR02757 family protein [Bacteroidota bacterium]MCB9042676.1 TIGR02757 family protein [Chitinophagales bacterium]